MPKVACPAHQVYHKESKKCVDIGSDEFHRILEKDLFAFDAYFKKIDKFLSTNKNTNSSKCPKDKVYNKYTKRCVTINSQSFFKALKDHPDVFDDQKDKISEVITKKLKKNVNPKLLVPKPVVAKKQNFSEFLNNNANKGIVFPRPRFYANKHKYPVTKLKNINQAKKLFTKIVKSKITNVPSKYLKKTKLPINQMNNKQFMKTTKIMYGLPYRHYTTEDIHTRHLNKATSVDLSYIVYSETDRYYKNVLNLDVSKELIDLKWYYECQKYIDSLSPREKWALKGYSYKGDVYVNLTERGMKVNFNNFSLTPFVYEFFQMIIEGKYVSEDKKFEKSKIDNYLQKKDGNALTDLTQIFLQMKLPVSVKKELITRFSKTLSNVIKRAPQVTSRMTVFRGVRDSFFTKSDYKNNKSNEIYLNKGFVSTSMKWSLSLDSFTGFGCCFNVITLLPGTRCLPLLGISKFTNEMEILLNKDTKFLIRRKFLAPKPKGDGKMKFSHIIVT